LLLGEVARAVERHVLDEVGEAELVVVLEDGARADDEAQLSAPLGARVLPHVVAKPVVERADPQGGIERQRVALRGGGRGGQSRQEEWQRKRDERARATRGVAWPAGRSYDTRGRPDRLAPIAPAGLQPPVMWCGARAV